MPQTQLINTDLSFVSVQYTFNDLAAVTTGTTTTFSLPALPQGSVILYVRIKHSQIFAATSLSTLTVKLGTATSSTAFSGTTFNLMASVADTTLLEATGLSMAQLSAVTPVVTFTTTTGGTISAWTTGIVNIDLLIAKALTPTFTSLYSSGSVL